MHQYTYLAVTFGVLLIILTSSSTTTTASAIPLIVCQPNSINESSQKVRQLCYALFEKDSANPQQEEGELIDAAPMFDKHMDAARGIKRQDVDHVFLRFGRRPSGL